MKKLRKHPSNLVPDLKTCKKLPWEDFQDVCFLWTNPVDDGWEVSQGSFCAGIPNSSGKPAVFPAPTTEELLARLPGVLLANFGQEGVKASICKRLIVSKTEFVVTFKPIEVRAETSQEALAQLYLKLRRAMKFHEKRMKEREVNGK